MSQSLRPCLKLLDGATAANGKPANTAATGSIPSTAGSVITDLTSFVLNDGINPPIQFVYAAAALAVSSATRVRIAYTAGDSAATVQAAVIAAINNVTTGLRITATDGGSNIVTLTNDFAGAHGNIAVGNNTGILITGMSGGIDVGFPLNGHVPGTPYHWNLHDTGIFLVSSVAGSGTMAVTLRWWAYSYLDFTWHPGDVMESGGAITDRGLLNKGNSIAEDGADKLTHAEAVNYLSGFDRIWMEIVSGSITGSGTAIDCYLNSTAKQVAR